MNLYIFLSLIDPIYSNRDLYEDPKKNIDANPIYELNEPSLANPIYSSTSDDKPGYDELFNHKQPSTHTANTSRTYSKLSLETNEPSLTNPIYSSTSDDKPGYDELFKHNEPSMHSANTSQTYSKLSPVTSGGNVVENNKIPDTASNNNTGYDNVQCNMIYGTADNPGQEYDALNQLQAENRNPNVDSTQYDHLNIGQPNLGSAAYDTLHLGSSNLPSQQTAPNATLNPCYDHLGNAINADVTREDQYAVVNKEEKQPQLPIAEDEYAVVEKPKKPATKKPIVEDEYAVVEKPKKPTTKKPSPKKSTTIVEDEYSVVNKPSRQPQSNASATLNPVYSSVNVNDNVTQNETYDSLHQAPKKNPQPGYAPLGGGGGGTPSLYDSVQHPPPQLGFASPSDFYSSLNGEGEYSSLNDAAMALTNANNQQDYDHLAKPMAATDGKTSKGKKKKEKKPKTKTKVEKRKRYSSLEEEKK